MYCTTLEIEFEFLNQTTCWHKCWPRVKDHHRTVDCRVGFFFTRLHPCQDEIHACEKAVTVCKLDTCMMFWNLHWMLVSNWVVFANMLPLYPSKFPCVEIKSQNLTTFGYSSVQQHKTHVDSNHTSIKSCHSFYYGNKYSEFAGCWYISMGQLNCTYWCMSPRFISKV